MRYTLKDYQAAAVRDCLQRLDQARDTYHRYESLSAFSLAATTGAGKTVMAAAIIEALFFGSDEFNFAADPGATVLWFSDVPALNEQSRDRIRAAASELDHRLRVVPNTFSDKSFAPGFVYFLNAQKLREGGLLVRGDKSNGDGEHPLFDTPPDMVQQTIYDVIRTTIETPGRTLYFILDEAHRGMKDGSRQTIVQRLINGEGSPPMPIVFGISATVSRFTDAMSKVTNRTTLPSVEVDADLVQNSGLLKDDIVLTIPTENRDFDTVLLRRAVGKAVSSTEAWGNYCRDQGEPNPVLPLLVIQVEDKPTEADLASILDIVYDEWPHLANDAVAHVFGSKTDLMVGQQSVPYIKPQDVADATYIRVLLAMESISVGWDCPRAEVLVSFRSRQDETYITQLLGRMLRTPLARRISGNELLNSVDCLLPHFDRETATSIAQMLMAGKTSRDDDGDGSGGTARRVLFDPVVLEPNPAIAEEVRALMESIPTVTIPTAHAKPIRRLDALATALSKDGLIPGAVDTAAKHLCKVLDGRAVQYDDLVASARTDVLTMTGEEARGRVGTEHLTYESFEVSADPRAIEESYQSAARQLTSYLAALYVEHLVGDDGDDADLLEANITVAALGRVPEIVADVEAEADAFARAWLAQTRVARKSLSDEQQADYDRLEGMSTTPERISLVAPTAAQAETKVREADGSEHLLPVRALHLMCDESGMMPIDLNSWETTIVDTESAREGFVAWYRNPGRATKESLAVAYRDDTGMWKAMRPDFMFFARNQDGTVAVDLVDPHGHHLADAIWKLRGLAEFAEQYGESFRRIESVAETNGSLRVLDFTKGHVRDAVRTASSAKALYESDVATEY